MKRLIIHADAENWILAIRAAKVRMAADKDTAVLFENGAKFYACRNKKSLTVWQTGFTKGRGL